MLPTALFIVRRSEPGTISGVLPAATAMPIGTALYISAKDADTGENTFALAAGRANGFVSREVRTTKGSTDAELVDQLVGLPMLETPFEAGKPGSIESNVTEVECEGSDYIFGSGTGQITADTAAGTLLSFTAGKFYVAQQDDFAQWRLVKQMTPETVGNTRIYVEKVEGYKVPA